MNFYNENDAYPAVWLRTLAERNLIPAGVVDERSISDLQPENVRGFTQAHFFAGIGGWPYALRLAGWPDGAPVWTGSCPCQPFSSAGRRKGHADERHLWPAWFRLIRECRPGVVFGEQVASKDGLAWLDAVRADMEAEGYAFGAADLCAAGVGAPHIRQRIYFVAYADGWLTSDGRVQRGGEHGLLAQDNGTGDGAGETSILGDPLLVRREGPRAEQEPFGGPCVADELEHADRSGCGQDDGARPERLAEDGEPPTDRGRGRVHADASFWSACDWLPCRDGKARPVEPGTFPLAHGVPARVGRLRAYGNAIVPQVAAEFVMAYMESVRC